MLKELKLTKDDFRAAVHAFHVMEKFTVSMRSIAGFKANGEQINREERITPDLKLFFESLANNMAEEKDNVKKKIEEALLNYPIYTTFLSTIKGCGWRASAVIISEIDIYKATYISDLWRYSGFGVCDGKREKRTKGEPLHYNNFLKKELHLLADSFIKQQNYYSQFYYKAKEKKENDGWGENKMRRHLHGMGIMIKEFEKDLYVAWRNLEGLEVSKPYKPGI